MTFTKEQLIDRINQVTAINKYRISRDPDADGLSMDNELLAIALASLEAEKNAEPVAKVETVGVCWYADNGVPRKPALGTELYTAPPAPVSVPDAIHSQGEKSASDDYYALGWNACRAAMLKHSEPFIVTSDHRMMEMPQVEAINAVTAILQGADGTLTNEGTIPVTQFKPVADLYGLTSPTGGETSFTFDAVEARDFIDGGWSCQEYVELGRFQEAMLQNGNSPAQSDCCPAQNYIAPAQDGNSPVIPDCSCGTCRPVTFTDSRFVVCSECGNKRCPHANDHRNACTGSNEPGQEGRAYPAAPQQEVK